MAQVHTEYGPGQIVASETVRGRKQYKVAGEGFEVWLDETRVAAIPGLRDMAKNPGHREMADEYDDPYMLDGAPLGLSPDEVNEAADYPSMGDFGPGRGDDFSGLIDPDEADRMALDRALLIDNPDFSRIPGTEHRDEFEDSDGLVLARRRRADAYTPAAPGDFSGDHWDGHREDMIATSPRPGWHDNPDGGWSEPGWYDETDPLDEIMAAEAGMPGGPHSPEYGAEDPRYYGEYPAHYDGRLAYAPMDLDNSVALPYDPSPQYPAIPGETESTIQPIHEIDADERLSPADSITFDDERDDEGGIDPHGDNFADPGGVLASRREANPALLAPLVRGIGMGLAADAFGGGHDGDDGGDDGGLLDNLRLGPGLDSSIYVGSYSGPEGLEQAREDQRGLHEGEAYDDWDRYLGDQGLADDGGMPLDEIGGHFDGFLAEHPHYGDDGRGDAVWTNIQDRYASNFGLSDKYIELTADVDHYSPEAQFRHDPVGYINRVGHVLTSGHEDPETEHYASLVEANKQIREAAWKDVRAKAMRLRREGKVKVKEITADAIYTAVNGDHDNYEVMIYKGGSFQGLGTGGSSSIGAWTCSCPWGKWAFKRQRTFVGRLCSHGYASYLEMQSAHLTGKPVTRRQTKRPMVKRQGGFEVEADALQNVPQRLVPDLTVNDTDDEHLLVDLQEDERDTTGPDGIVHFSGRGVGRRHASHLNRTDVGMTDAEHAVLRAAAFARRAEDQTTQDWKVQDTGEARGALEEIREIAETPLEEDFGDMADRAEAVRNAVDEARENGVDASYLVAGLQRTAAPLPVQPIGPGINPNVAPGSSSGGSTLGPEMPGGLFNWKNWGGSSQGFDNSSIVDQANSQNSGAGLFGVPSGGGDVINAGGAPSGGGKGSLSPLNAGGADNSFGGASSEPKGGSPTGGSGGSSGAGGSDGGQGTGSGGAPDTGSTGWSRNENANAIGDDKYTVQRGDTLSDIATRAGYGDNYQGLADQLGIKDPNMIGEGQELDFTKATEGRDLANAKGIGTGKGLDTSSTGENGSGDGSWLFGGDSGAATDGGAGKGGAESGAASGGSSALGLGSAGSSMDIDTKAVGGTSGSGGVNTDALATPATPAAPDTSANSSTLGDQKNLQTTGRRTAMPGDGGSAYGNQPMDGEGKNMDTYSDQGGTPYPSVSGEGKNSFGPNSLPSTPGELGTGQGVRLPDYGDIAGPIAGGVGGALTGIGGAFPGLPPLHGSYLTAAQIEAADSGVDVFLQPGSHHPFNGSGWPGPLEIGTSADYVEEHERPHFQDVTDLNGVIEYVDDEPHRTAGVRRLGKTPRAVVVPEVVREQRPTRQRGAAVEHVAELDDYDPLAPRTAASFDDDAGDDDMAAVRTAAATDDIVAAFQRSAGAQAVMAANSGGGKSDDDIAGAAQAFLRTAGRNYSLAEQDELINERHASGARNLDQLDLANTHYSTNSVGLL